VKQQWISAFYWQWEQQMVNNSLRNCGLQMKSIPPSAVSG
jgi:hypothetical protein